MVKIIKLNGTQLTTKPAVLSEINDDGFILVNEDGEEDTLSFESIREYFCEKTVKIKIEEMSKSTIE